MEATVTYAWLMNDREGALQDPFDAHVLASVLAVAIAEAKAAGLSLSESTGLSGAALTALMRAAFPQAVSLLERCGGCQEVSISEDERCLRELLVRSTTNRTPFQLHFAALIARRSMRPNHLWQDLGFRNRRELSDLMHKHFKPLAVRNVNDMKWKKFFYRMICRDEGFRLCMAPTCSECVDFSACFGDESGESLLARNRREAELRL
jgi:nitrogen fixation protein NifQ